MTSDTAKHGVKLECQFCHWGDANFEIAWDRTAALPDFDYEERG
jgi:hypothetical protein